MKISLLNKSLDIKLKISIEPDYKKLHKELLDYFSENPIDGRKITKFRFSEYSNNSIIPEEPRIEDKLIGGKYQEDLKRIGDKYGINNLKLAYWCYKDKV